MASNFIAFELRAHSFSAFIDVLTPNTYILVVMPANAAESATTLMNIAVARKHFEKLERDSGASARAAERGADHSVSNGYYKGEA